MDRLLGHGFKDRKQICPKDVIVSHRALSRLDLESILGLKVVTNPFHGVSSQEILLARMPSHSPAADSSFHKRLVLNERLQAPTGTTFDSSTKSTLFSDLFQCKAIKGRFFSVDQVSSLFDELFKYFGTFAIGLLVIWHGTFHLLGPSLDVGILSEVNYRFASCLDG